MRYLCLLPLLAVCSCGKKSPEPAPAKVRMEKSDVLSPADLSIWKERFTARPEKHEVAIFRSSFRSFLEPPAQLVMDQIFWTNGGEAHVDLAVVPLSFYLGYPEWNGKEETMFQDTWNLRAGGFSHAIKDYRFNGSSFSSGNSETKGFIAYTKNSKTSSTDLLFNFRMFIVSLEEAKKMHPELDTERPLETNQWQATHLYKGEIEELGLDRKGLSLTPR